jgi:dTDP-4-dehydrorhamnose reductase
MLGSMIVEVLSREGDISVTATARSSALAARFQALYPQTRWTEFKFDVDRLLIPDSLLPGHDWIINAIGITKPLIHEDDAAEIGAAIGVNSLLPHRLGQMAQSAGARVLQIATDCVYSGAKGGYVEGDAHDALDVYGKTKSLGETYLQPVHHLRCSIIGPEAKEFKFLVEWFRRQPHAAQVSGFVNHRWNGVTTLHFARLCLGIIRSGLPLAHAQHVIPAGTLTKAEMLKAFGRAFDRQDIMVRDVEAKTIVDRTLGTDNHLLNAALWKAAGYPQPPAVADMILELAQYGYRAAPRGAAI